MWEWPLCRNSRRPVRCDPTACKLNCDHRYLRRTIPPKRNRGKRSHTRVHVKRAARCFKLPEIVTSNAHGNNEWAIQRQTDLSAMRVTRENQIEFLAERVSHARI